MAKRDGIEQGLVCIFSVVEPCRTNSLRWQQRHYVQFAKRKCLFLYYYFMDPDLGLIHVKLQTWFPLQLQVYVNGHEWLARKLTRHGIRYTKLDNAFLWIEDFPLFTKICRKACVHAARRRRRVAVAFCTLSSRYS